MQYNNINSFENFSNNLLKDEFSIVYPIISFPINNNTNTGNEITVLTIRDNDIYRIPLLATPTISDNTIYLYQIQTYKKNAIKFGDKYVINFYKDLYASNKLRESVNSSDLENKKINLQTDDILISDIIAKEYIPIIEDNNIVAKQIGIKPNGSIVLISYTSLYILLIVILILIIGINLNKSSNINKNKSIL